LIVAGGEIAGAVLGLGCRNIARRARPYWVPWAVTIQFSNQFCCFRFRFLLILVMSASV
jgi:hypothetical protein